MGEVGGPGPHGGHGRQGGHQVGALGHVQLCVAGLGQLPILEGDDLVPLLGLHVQSLNIHLSPQKVGGVPEGGLGPVGLHGKVPALIVLITGDMEGVRPFLHSDAEGAEHIQGQVHISP